MGGREILCPLVSREWTRGKEGFPDSPKGRNERSTRRGKVRIHQRQRKFSRRGDKDRVSDYLLRRLPPLSRWWSEAHREASISTDASHITSLEHGVSGPWTSLFGTTDPGPLDLVRIAHPLLEKPYRSGHSTSTSRPSPHDYPHPGGQSRRPPRGTGNLTIPDYRGPLCQIPPL